MSSGQADLHFLCGKIAAGKSTLAKALAAEHRAVVLSEDEWLPLLYPDELLTIPDYVRCSTRLKTVVGPLVRDLLKLGEGSVLTLDKRLEDPVELYVGDRLIGIGALEVLEGGENGQLAVRLTEVVDLKNPS